MLGFSVVRPVVGKADEMVARPIDEVFHYISDGFFANYPKWSPEVQHLEPLGDPPLRLGSVVRQVRVDYGQRSESTFRVVEYRRGARLAFAGLSDPYFCSYDLEDITSSTLTRVVFTFELKELELFMRPFEKLIRVAIQEGARQTVSNIKRLIESPTSSLGAIV